jgi:hypothetical protein
MYIKKTISGGFRFIKSQATAIKLCKFKQAHKGNIGFLIGNGPSVRIEDLEKLANQVTFCCNRFHLAYKDMRFRPTYTFATDKQTIEDFGEGIVANSERKVFLAWNPEWGAKPKIKGNYILLRLVRGQFHFSENVALKVSPGGSTLIGAMQVGYYMGINKFVFYGIDHNYPNTNIKKDAKEIWRSARGEGNHFINDYRSGKPWCPPIPEFTESCLVECDNFLRAKGGYLKNATRGGKLEVLERVNFDVLIKELNNN